MGITTGASSIVPPGKRLLFWLIILAIPLVAIEVGLRAYFSFQLGPSILFYGTRLNRVAPDGQRFEVINFGIPHLKSEQILALFESEVLALQPDVVTFYEGVNDTWRSRIVFNKTRLGVGVVLRPRDLRLLP